MVRQMLTTSPPTLSPIASASWNKPICYSRPRTRDVAIYASGALFAIGWWTFIDAILYLVINKSEDSSKIFVRDWICGVLTTFGMIIVNSIDKSIITDEIYAFSIALRRARVFLTVGYTLLVGGFIGSLTVFIFNYIPDKPKDEFHFGMTIVAQNFLILMSSIVLSIGQSSPDDPKYDFLL